MLILRSYILFLIGASGMISLSSCNSSTPSFDPISRHIFNMDIQEVDLQTKFFSNRHERNTILTELKVSGYSNIDCQDENFDECLVQYYESDSKTYEFNVKLGFKKNDLTTAIGQFTWIRNAKNN